MLFALSNSVEATQGEIVRFLNQAHSEPIVPILLFLFRSVIHKLLGVIGEGVLIGFQTAGSEPHTELRVTS